MDEYKHVKIEMTLTHKSVKLVLNIISAYLIGVHKFNAAMKAVGVSYKDLGVEDKDLGTTDKDVTQIAMFHHTFITAYRKSVKQNENRKGN